MIHVLFEQSNTFRDIFNEPENRVRGSEIEHKRGIARSIIHPCYARNFINNIEW